MTDTNTNIRSASELGVFATIRRGVEVTPELLHGIWLTMFFAVLAAAGKVTVPLAIQQAVDTSVTDGPIDTQSVFVVCAVALGALILAGVCNALMNVRLIRAAETGLAKLRERAFDHIHQLTVLTLNTERTGSLVSRVTSDVDTISMFVQWGGIMLLTSALQLVAATAVMFWFSWELTLLVWVTFIPFVILLQPAQKAVNRGFTAVRAKMGAMLGSFSEAAVGAETITAYGIGARTESKMNAAVQAHRHAGVTALKRVALSFSAGVFAANLVLVVVVVAGAYLGVGGGISAGTLIAFLFLVQLFTGPVQMATEVLNEMQNAVAGWRRVLAILETDRGVTFPTQSKQTAPTGPAHLLVENLDYNYPGGPKVLSTVNLDIAPGKRVAVVGETGSGKTTLAKLLTRFVDPTAGAILLDGIDLRDYSEADLRRRILLVPQEGFLFADTLRANISYPLVANGTLTPEQIDHAVSGAITALELDGWVAGFPNGIESHVGQRGERLSAGERQLVALARAYVCEADLLVMDEVTSAVDPATEAAISRALDALMAEKSTVTIAHRLTTAQHSDLVIVMDKGEVVEHGHHNELLQLGGRYAGMFGAWLAQTNSRAPK